MFARFLYRKGQGRTYSASRCYILSLCAIWLQTIHALSSAMSPEVDYGLLKRVPINFGLIPSAPISISTLSLTVQSSTGNPVLSVSPPLPPGPLPSQQSEDSPTLVLPTPGINPSEPVPSLSGLLPSATSDLAYDPPVLTTTKTALETSATLGNVTDTSAMQSTTEGLKPIPPAETQDGDPNGHHEITEPNFTTTKLCRGCSPVIEITASGWLDPAEQHGSTLETPMSTTDRPIEATISIGHSNILISQGPTGDDYVIGGSMTVTPGQTVTVGDAPIAIQTSEGHMEAVLGTTIIALQPDGTSSQYANNPQITDAPVLRPPVVVIGTETITPNEQTQYVIADQTLAPGGPALTISRTTLSLAPSATALVINGETSSLTPLLGKVYTTVAPAALTFSNRVYTANRAGYIILGPGTTLIPGGYAVTVDGTTLSLEHSGTAVIVQGTTRALQPVTTVVTLTRGVGAGNGGLASSESTAFEYPYPTEKPLPANAMRFGDTIADRWLGGVVLLVWCSVGLFAVRL
ncbi:hypothetical protein T440DRAFT_478825 [Plenodomus tracheiphilus IPT5]|uniref:Uncharacterized protein n=1 Tax=Plenodomus tracheiphilus IPT5 TaxID=1408161 RepID=A0A6A7B958_9PLEO|nr:hypothetical protein T440DRAFT_478825 [Plenodomus tracheiphilus IPT5]